MSYYENEAWKEYYLELDPDKREELYKEIVNNVEDDGANALRKQLFDWRYIDPKKPNKKVDKGIWEMVLMPAHVRGFIAFSSQCRTQINASLNNLKISDETRNNEILASAIYWEIRNIAKRFYSTCESPKYGRKFFGLAQSNWDEKLDRVSRDIWTMAEYVPKKFGMKEEMKIFSDAVLDEFFSYDSQAKQIYFNRKYQLVTKKLPFVI